MLLYSPPVGVTGVPRLFGAFNKGKKDNFWNKKRKKRTFFPEKRGKKDNYGIKKGKKGNINGKILLSIHRITT